MKLVNSTPFDLSTSTLALSSLASRSAAHLRATFNYGQAGQTLVLSDEQGPPPLADCYSGDPVASSLIEPSFLHMGKPGTDVLVTGVAYAPNLIPSYHWNVSVEAPGLKNQLTIFGDRMWEEGRIQTLRKRLNTVIQYEYAFGGTHSNEPQANPAGIGLSPDDMLLPSIEDSTQLIAHRDHKPMPAGLGPIAPHWAQRLRYAGTYDSVWTATRAPFLPTDQNPKYNHAAHPNMQTSKPFSGGETILIKGMHPETPLSLTLPNISFTAQFYITGQESVRSFFSLETVSIDTQATTLTMDWRAFADHKGGVENVRRIQAQERR